MKIIIPDKKIMRGVMEKLWLSDGQQQIRPERYYSFPFSFLYLKRLRMALNLMGEKRYKKTLDIGFGSGIFLPSLGQTTKELYGIDSHDYINLVEKAMGKTGTKVELKKGSVLQVPYGDNTFDCVNCLSVLEFVEDIEKAMSEISRVSKPGARAIIGAPVVNKLTDFCYKLIGKKNQKKMHKSNHEKIIKSASKYFNIDEIATLPSFLPVGYSLFFVLSAKNKKL